MSPRSRQERLPTVLVTSVIRASNKGQSHGGAYLVDLETSQTEQVLDWNQMNIDWAGRGGDRGLRGIAFWERMVYLAASNEVLVFDRDFSERRRIGSPYLSHCHEIDIDDGRLYLTSCGHDSILEYDLREDRFTDGFCLRPGRISLQTSRLLRRGGIERSAQPRLQRFDPGAEDGPVAGDTIHLNSVRALSGTIYAAAKQGDYVVSLREGRLERYATIPSGTHNAQPFDQGVLLNDTAGDQILLLDRAGKEKVTMRVMSQGAGMAAAPGAAEHIARANWARGLAVWRQRYVIGGSSPATISCYDLLSRELVTSVQLSRDIRNAVHGLEVWPF